MQIFVFLLLFISLSNSLFSRIPFVKRSKAFSPKIGIAVIAYNRPQYLQKVISALEKNPESKRLPFYFFLDGGPHSTQKKNQIIINNSKIKNKKIILRPSNYGIGRNTIDARRYMFDVLNFDILFVFEDDNIVSPSYITLVLNLYKWANAKYDNIGIVKAWNPCLLSIEEKLKDLNKVTETVNHLWAYCIDKKTWNKIKDLLYEYEQKFLLSKNYKSRDSQKIKQWIRNKLIFRNRRHKFNKPYPTKINYLQLFLSPTWPTGQDGITYIAHYLGGFISLTTAVNRKINIGKIGYHYTPKQWQRMKLDKIKLDNFSQDKNIKEFKPV